MNLGANQSHQRDAFFSRVTNLVANDEGLIQIVIENSCREYFERLEEISDTYLNECKDQHEHSHQANQANNSNSRVDEYMESIFKILISLHNSQRGIHNSQRLYTSNERGIHNSQRLYASNERGITYELIERPHRVISNYSSYFKHNVDSYMANLMQNGNIEHDNCNGDGLSLHYGEINVDGVDNNMGIVDANVNAASAGSTAEESYLMRVVGGLVNARRQLKTGSAFTASTTTLPVVVQEYIKEYSILYSNKTLTE